MNFLDDKYEVPNKASNYMKFQDGENRFRFLSSPILGWEAWIDTPEGGRKPLRKKMDEKFTTDEVDDPSQIKHFWAAVVWNYAEEKVQILEITQKGIQKTLRALAKDQDWGSPLEYDIVVTREGKELNTTYQVNPKPAKPVSDNVLAEYGRTPVDLTKLYTGEDPFSTEDEIDNDKVAEALQK